MVANQSSIMVTVPLLSPTASTIIFTVGFAIVKKELPERVKGYEMLRPIRGETEVSHYDPAATPPLQKKSKTQPRSANGYVQMACDAQHRATRHTDGIGSSVSRSLGKLSKQSKP